jgi:hypothetical protein
VIIYGARKTGMDFKNLLRGAALAALFASRVGAVDNGLAITPQMGCEFSSSLTKPEIDEN